MSRCERGGSSGGGAAADGRWTRRGVQVLLLDVAGCRPTSARNIGKVVVGVARRYRDGAPGQIRGFLDAGVGEYLHRRRGGLQEHPDTLDVDALVDIAQHRGGVGPAEVDLLAADRLSGAGGALPGVDGQVDTVLGKDALLARRSRAGRAHRRGTS